MNAAPHIDRERHRAYLEDDLALQQRGLESVTRDRQRAPWLLALLVLTIPAGIFIGALAAVFVVLGTFALLVTAFYLVTVHASEYRDRIRALEKQLATFERSPPR